MPKNVGMLEWYLVEIKGVRKGFDTAVWVKSEEREREREREREYNSVKWEDARAIYN